MNIILKKATANDLEPIYQLYSKYFGEKITFELFKKIHLNYWHSDEDYFGYVLYDDKIAVAFCGYIFAKRLIYGKEQKFCNFCGWVVEKDYRKEYKTEVLKPLLKMAEEGYTLTGLSPTPQAYKVEKELGFKDLEHGKIKYTFNPFKINLKVLKKLKIFTNNSTITDAIRNKQILKIHENHLVFQNIERLLIKINNEEIYLIYKFFTKKKIIKMMDILYISDPSLFFKEINLILNSLFIHARSFGLRVESRFVPEKIKNRKNFIPYLKPHIYLSKNLKPSEIDILYTEKFLLYHLGV